MKTSTTSPLALASKAELTAAVEEARDAVGASFERFCLVAGLASLTQMLEEDATALAGAPHARSADKQGTLGRTRARWAFTVQGGTGASAGAIKTTARSCSLPTGRKLRRPLAGAMAMS